jgi:hypothetical protein
MQSPFGTCSKSKLSVRDGTGSFCIPSVHIHERRLSSAIAASYVGSGRPKEGPLGGVRARAVGKDQRPGLTAGVCHRTGAGRYRKMDGNR